MKSIRKRTSIVSLIVILVLLLSACSGKSVDDTTTTPTSDKPAATTTDDEQKSDETAQPTEISGGTLKVGEYVLDTQMANKNPYLKSGVWLNQFYLIYEGLFYYNPVNGETEPALAKSYTWSEDFKTITVELNTDAKWQDGEAFTAEDVVYTYQNLIDFPALDTYGIGKHIESINATGSQVMFKLNSPFTSFVNYAASVYIVPKHLWEGQDPTTNINEKPIGTGPFVFSAYNTGTDIQFTANKEYWRGAPQIDDLVVQMYNSAPNLTLALLKGEIHATFGAIAMSSIPEFLTKDGAKMQLYGGNANFIVMMNNENPVLSDINVRKAMVMAINQADLISKGEYNAVFPTSLGWLPDSFGDYVNTSAKELVKFDLEAAKKVLEDAGYTKGSDGVYQKDGKRLSFTYYNASGAPAQQMEAGMIQQWLLNLGVEIIPKLATWPELTVICQKGEYDLIQNQIQFPFDPYAALNSSFNSAMTAPIGTVSTGTNYFRFRNDEVDSLLAEAATLTDPAAQKEVYNKIQEVIANQYVFLPMYNVGGHVPYYDAEFTGWAEDAPILLSPEAIIGIHKK